MFDVSLSFAERLRVRAGRGMSTRLINCQYG